MVITRAQTINSVMFSEDSTTRAPRLRTASAACSRLAAYSEAPMQCAEASLSCWTQHLGSIEADSAPPASEAGMARIVGWLA
jgi:hypothetical protein